jgi:hypothetical protein
MKKWRIATFDSVLWTALERQKPVAAEWQAAEGSQRKTEKRWLDVRS